MQRLLIVSDSPALYSGQARVVRELAGRFHQAGVQLAVAGWFHVMMADPEPLPYQVFPAWKDKPEMLGPILEMFEPDTVLAIGDPWDFRWLAEYRAAGAPFTLVGYLNVEAAPIPPMNESILDAFDVLTTTSEYGAQVVGRPYVKAIHHGVDMKVFHPTPKPEEFLDRKLAETFVVLLNGQNIQRKNLVVALKGFARFAEGHTDVFCYANTVPEPGDMGLNLKALVMQLGLQDKIAFERGNRGPLDTVDDRHMNAIYSMADVLLMPSIAEGFGLPILEAMATNTVPIATNASSMPELIGEREARGGLIPVVGHWRGPYGSDMAVVNEDGVAAKLEGFYGAWRQGTLSRYHRMGVAFAMSRPWDRTYERLCDAMAAPRSRERAAAGQEIDPYLRMKAKAAAARHPGAIGVLKLGGLGDMLKVATVVRAAARKYATKVVVFCNRHPDVFQDMPEVAEVVRIQDNIQATVVRSIADEFPVFLDVRYVSRAYGDVPTEFFTKHTWMYEHWAMSCARLADLNMHAMAIMIESLGLQDAMFSGRLSALPTFDARAGGPAMAEPYVAVATGVGQLGTLKAWPKEYWEVLAEKLDAEGIALVQVGGADDTPVPGSMDCRDLPLDRTASILEHAVCCVAVEGGMAHLAAAVGTRSVVIFGPTPKRVFGYKVNINLGGDACTPCWWMLPGWYNRECAIAEPQCVNFPTPEEVFGATLEFWDQHVPRREERSLSLRRSLV